MLVKPDSLDDTSGSFCGSSSDVAPCSGIGDDSPGNAAVQPDDRDVVCPNGRPVDEDTIVDHHGSPRPVTETVVDVCSPIDEGTTVDPIEDTNIDVWPDSSPRPVDKDTTVAEDTTVAVEDTNVDVWPDGSPVDEDTTVDEDTSVDVDTTVDVVDPDSSPDVGIVADTAACD